MSPLRHRRCALAAAVIACSSALAARAVTVAVSPGETDHAVEAASGCPTFSWSASPGATGYELAVLRLDHGEEPEVVWSRTVAGSATSWSPSRRECLEAGGRYAWTVRALGADAAAADSEWAAVRRFDVPAAPGADEIAAALATLERWRQAGGGVSGAEAVASGLRPAPASTLHRMPANAPGGGSLSLASGVAAIRGENPDISGSALGVLGLSHSPAGAAVVARNESSGADLVLDGEANAATDSLLRQDSLDRPSANLESFDFRNSGAGSMALKVDGVAVVTTATDQDTLGALSCPDGQIAKRSAGIWQCANDNDTPSTYTAGNQLQLSGSQFNVVEGPASGLDADTVDGLDSTALATAGHGHFGASWTGIGTALTLENLGTSGDLSGLVSRTNTESGAAVYGQHAHPTAVGYGVYGTSASTNGVGVYGNGARYGVEGSSAGGYGVYATGGLGGVYASSVTSPGVAGLSTSGYGVYGQAAQIGVRGENWNPSGSGVNGEALATSGNAAGVVGRGNSPTGAGVYGNAPAFGVAGDASAPTGIGVKGLASATSGNATGVAGYSNSPTGAGVYGSSPGLGVAGDGSTGNGIGVKGVGGPTGTGVAGYSAGTGVFGSGGWNGVYGEATVDYGVGVYGQGILFPNARAGQFFGNVWVNGTLSKNAGSFKIDHPLDPENKYLYHSFVESPDMMNIYNGNVTLDASGSAWIELPAWFEALNREFRYQLTPLGDWSACWVAQEIARNRFRIQGGPGARVSWQVTGIRHDRWAEAHRIPVEEDKPAPERGTYLTPEAWGMPRERGTDWPRAAAAAALEQRNPQSADEAEANRDEAP